MQRSIVSKIIYKKGTTLGGGKKLDLKFSSKPRHWKGKCERELNVKQSYMYPADIVLDTAAAAAFMFLPERKKWKWLVLGISISLNDA